MPLLKTKMALKTMAVGEVLRVRATDAGSWRDIPAYIGMTNHLLLSAQESPECFEFWIQKGDC